MSTALHLFGLLDEFRYIRTTETEGENLEVDMNILIFVAALQANTRQDRQVEKSLQVHLQRRSGLFFLIR